MQIEKNAFTIILYVEERRKVSSGSVIPRLRNLLRTAEVINLGV
jgi:hypothetical protein